MDDTERKDKDTEPRDTRRRGGSGGDVVYAFGIFGALVFYIQQADGFWQGALGILKAFIWPAFLVYELLNCHRWLIRSLRCPRRCSAWGIGLSDRHTCCGIEEVGLGEIKAHGQVLTGTTVASGANLAVHIAVSSVSTPDDCADPVRSGRANGGRNSTFFSSPRDSTVIASTSTVTAPSGRGQPCRRRSARVAAGGRHPGTGVRRQANGAA